MPETVFASGPLVTPGKGCPVPARPHGVLGGPCSCGIRRCSGTTGLPGEHLVLGARLAEGTRERSGAGEADLKGYAESTSL